MAHFLLVFSSSSFAFSGRSTPETRPELTNPVSGHRQDVVSNSIEDLSRKPPRSTVTFLRYRIPVGLPSAPPCRSSEFEHGTSRGESFVENPVPFENEAAGSGNVGDELLLLVAHESSSRSMRRLRNSWRDVELEIAIGEAGSSARMKQRGARRTFPKGNDRPEGLD